MLRPAVLFRAIAAPPRWMPLPLPLPRQFAPSLILTTSRRCLATEASSTPQPSLESASPTSTAPTSEAPTKAPPVPNQTKKATKPAKQQQQQQQQQQQRPNQRKPPFHVARTPSGNLAVYELAKRGGNKKLTLLKKIEGDRAALRAALAEGLKITEKDVKLNTLTGHLRVEGHRKTEITAWLEQQGF